MQKTELMCNCANKVELNPEIGANSEEEETYLGAIACDHCRFSHRDYCGYRECRRRAPVENQKNGLPYWPKVPDAAWCGEFEAWNKEV